jgi:D-glycero-D-manno-heptose 1,7-bisphosphate phosphatase
MSAPAAFLDRDGVLIVDSGYPHRADQLVFIPGAAAAVCRLNEAGFTVVVVTNQSGVGRGYFTEADMHRFHGWMDQALGEAGARLDAIYACPSPDDAHPDRKPNPGMILTAAKDLELDLSRSILIGDKGSDIEAASRAGVKGFLFLGGDLDVFVASLL